MNTTETERTNLPFELVDTIMKFSGAYHWNNKARPYIPDIKFVYNIISEQGVGGALIHLKEYYAYANSARKYFGDAPGWVFDNETVKQSIRTKNWGTYKGWHNDGTRGLLGWTIDGPDGSEYTFKYHGIQFVMAEERNCILMNK